MTVREELASGRLDQAIEAAYADVRARPLDHDARGLLLDLLCFTSQWDRAFKQIDVIEAGGADPRVGVYRGLIEAERARQRFFAVGERMPGWLVAPPAWMADHLAGCDLLRRGEPESARVLLKQAEAALPDLEVRLGDVRFDGFRNLDDRLGPILEIMTPSGYTWIPWEDIEFLDVSAPVVPRDLLWVPARLASCHGPLARVFVPALYPGTSLESDGTLRLGRETRWRDLGAGLAQGLGLQTFLAGEESRTIMELNNMRFKQKHVPESK